MLAAAPLPIDAALQATLATAYLPPLPPDPPPPRKHKAHLEQLQQTQPPSPPPSSPPLPRPPPAAPALPSAQLPGFLPPPPEATLTGEQRANLAGHVLRTLLAADRPATLRAALVEACKPAVVSDTLIASAVPAAWERLKLLDEAQAEAEARAAAQKEEEHRQPRMPPLPPLPMPNLVIRTPSERAPPAGSAMEAVLETPVRRRSGGALDDDSDDSALDSARSRAPTAMGGRLNGGRERHEPMRGFAEAAKQLQPPTPPQQPALHDAPTPGRSPQRFRAERRRRAATGNTRPNLAGRA